MTKSSQPRISAAQIRAGRSLIGWSQEDLALASSLSTATIRKLELGHISPRQTTNEVMRVTLERAGLEFLESDGVRRRTEEVTLYIGREGLNRFLDKVYETSLKKDAEILVACASERPFADVLGPTDTSAHLERMTKVRSRFSHKCLLTEKPSSPLLCSDYCTYRYISKHYVDSVPFYLYDDRYAVILFEALESPKIIEIQSTLMSNAFKRQFNSIWDKAIPITGA